MSGREQALDRLLAHEARRQVRVSPEEREWIYGHPETFVRWINQVDRAVSEPHVPAEFHPPKERAA